LSATIALATVVCFGFVFRSFWWIRPKRRSRVPDDASAHFDLRRPRDILTALLLLVGTAIGVVLVVGALWSKVH
jgi:hypothetical protein